jgi:4-oxalocrotonate tautomerase family enzyme
MPLISIRLVAGRSHEELAALTRGVSEATAEALQVPVERVGVHIFELEKHLVGRGGELLGVRDPDGSA